MLGDEECVVKKFLYSSQFFREQIGLFDFEWHWGILRGFRMGDKKTGNIRREGVLLSCRFEGWGKDQAMKYFTG